jgi:tRNA-specific 2-thiouridylase
VADKLEIKMVATGHYAQIEELGGIFKLLKGQDEQKDQSYFLYRLNQKELARIIFPLGDKQKDDIKKESLENGWFEKIEESQDVCFLENEETTRDFLKRKLDKHQNLVGDIEDEAGKVLGEHQGLVYYTQGQRKGLDLSGGPFYVVGKDLSRNVLQVSENKEHPALINKEIYLERVNWIFGELDENKVYQFKSRFRAKASSGLLVKEKNNWKVVLEESQWAVAEGQSMVVYDDKYVLGGGIIKEVQ